MHFPSNPQSTNPQPQHELDSYIARGTPKKERYQMPTAVLFSLGFLGAGLYIVETIFELPVTWL